MNIEQAKQIPLKLIIEHFGGKFSHYNNAKTEAWYFSPLRPQERTASFKVNEKRNTWFDFGHVRSLNKAGSGGDILDLWCDFYQQDRQAHVKDALAGLASLGLQPYTNDLLQPVIERSETPKVPRWKILTVHNKIFYPSLKEELSKRRISKDIASLYLKQVFFMDTEKPDKKLNGLAFENINGGCEICIPNPIKNTCFKTAIKKGPSLIQGTGDDKVSIFEGFWDFLSWLELHNFTYPPHDCYILHSNSFAPLVGSMVQKRSAVKFACSYLDNDESGYQTTHSLALMLEPDGISFQDMSPNFKEYKDVSEFWMDRSTMPKLGFLQWKNSPISAPLKYS